MATTINPCVYHNIINSASSLLVRWQSFYSCSFHMQVAPWRKPHRIMSNFMRRRYMRPGMMQHSIFASTSASPSEQMVINYYRVGNLSFGDRRASIIFIVNAPQTAVCVCIFLPTKMRMVFRFLLFFFTVSHLWMPHHTSIAGRSSCRLVSSCIANKMEWHRSVLMCCW